MKIYVCNAFSLSMLDPKVQNLAPNESAVYGWPRTPRPVGGDGSTESAIAWLAANPAEREIISAVGHVDTAALFSRLLGREIPVNRISIKLTGHAGSGDVALVGQLQGPRLQEGATELPEGASIEWWLV